jgi:nucleotide-binding universal stress UspA family protein
VISLSSILVDVDATREHHPALERALLLAARAQAHIKIVDILPDVPSRARRVLSSTLEEELATHRRERLAAIAATVKDVPVTVELLRGRPMIALVQEVLRSNHSLLMRSHGSPPRDPGRPFGAVDMQLLRECPCPVWVIRPGTGDRRSRRILAAIDANPKDEAEQEINTTILELALLIRQLENDHLTLLHAWTVYGESLLKSHMPAEELAEAGEAARRDAENAIAALIEPFQSRMTGVAVEVVKGEPRDVIPQFVEVHGIDVVIMGTVGRAGIAGRVMGNTAEHVLQRLRGSVVAVKPSGFESHVKLPGAEHGSG